MKYIDVLITEDMLAHAVSVESLLRINRTRASSIDTLTGAVGELAFADWFLGDWRLHDLTSTKGQIDFLNAIEVKTSTFPFSEQLNLLVRSDYANVRSPKVYVQNIICTSDRRARQIIPGTNCRLAGWATHEKVVSAPLKDFGSKFGGPGGYSCHHIKIMNLHPMSAFPIKLA